MFGADWYARNTAGLHLLEAQPQDVRTRRMEAVQEAARRSRTDFPDALMHLELASVAQATFMAEIADAVFPLVDSIGACRYYPHRRWCRTDARSFPCVRAMGIDTCRSERARADGAVRGCRWGSRGRVR